MALGLLKTLGSGLGEEIREVRSIIGRIRLTSDSTAIGANFRKFGSSFNTYDFDAFLLRARDFFEEGMNSADPGFSQLLMPDNRIAIDYKAEIRGIFTRKGKPLAFFRPDYRLAGYGSKEEELADFMRGKNVLFG